MSTCTLDREFSDAEETITRPIKTSLNIDNVEKPNILSGSFIIYSLKRAISGLIFILLLNFYYSNFVIVGSKFAVFALFYFVFEGNFPSKSPRGVYIWRCDLKGGFFALPVWGAYIWRGLYREGPRIRIMTCLCLDVCLFIISTRAELSAKMKRICLPWWSPKYGPRE